jgi:hypothetical protein
VWKPWRTGLLLLATGSSGFLMFQLLSLPPEANRSALLLLWGAAIGLYAMALAPRPRSAARPNLARGRWAFPLLIGILGLGAYLRVAVLSAIPFTLGGDEAAQGLEAV